MRIIIFVPLLLAAPLFADPPKAEGDGDSKAQLARVNIRSLDKVLEYFNKKKGAYPAKLEVLQTVGYVEPGTLVDPWKNEYHYDRTGKRNGGKKADVWVVTPGQRILGNWPEKKEKHGDGPTR